MAKKPSNVSRLDTQEVDETNERYGILRNVKLLSIIGGVIIAVGIGVFILMQRRAESNRDAQVELSRIRPYYDRGEFVIAITGDSAQPVGTIQPHGLRYIVDEWSSVPAGKIAALYLANSYLATGDVAKAKEPYEIATGADDELIRAAAQAGLAAVAEAGGTYSEAADHYVKAASEDRLELNSPDYLLGAARNYEKAGEVEEAKKYYRTVATRFSGSQLNSQANLQARLALARLKVEL